MIAATMADQADVLHALRVLYSEDFEVLPAIEVRVEVNSLVQLTLSLHSDASTLADFEAWREALRITPEKVEYRMWHSGMVLEARGTLCGCMLRLQAYGPLLAGAVREAVA